MQHKKLSAFRKVQDAGNRELSHASRLGTDVEFYYSLLLRLRGMPRIAVSVVEIAADFNCRFYVLRHEMLNERLEPNIELPYWTTFDTFSFIFIHHKVGFVAI